MFNTFLVTIGAPVFLVLGFLMLYFILTVVGVDISAAVSFALLTAPIWLPLTLFYLTFERWMWFVRLKYAVENGRTTLRVKLPQEVFKSPEAMESVLNQTYNPASVSNLMEAYLQGKHPLVVSLEIASIGGEVRFYVNVPTKKVKNVIEAQFYAQYPGIEIVEEPIDYAAEVKWEPDKMDLMSFHIGKKKDDILPIKTYIDYGLDKLPKEEEKVDPMTPIIEHLASVKPHERLWIQFLLKPHAEEGLSSGSLSYKPTWEGAAADKVNEIMKRDRTKGSEDEDNLEQVRLTPGERDMVEAIERNTSKWAFETVIRIVYITLDKDNFDGDMIGPFLRYWAAFDVIGRNKVGFQWRTDFDYNFISDPTGSRRKGYKKQELEDYKKRYYYRADVLNDSDRPKVMSIEEIATMYHIPGSVVLSPGLTRIDSQKREAPANLPTGTPTHLPS